MFNITMDPTRHNIGEEATCTTCTFAEDFSNYWTATLFFRARNGSYIRVPQRANVDFDGARGGGMTVYYTASCKFSRSSSPLNSHFSLCPAKLHCRTNPSLKTVINPHPPTPTDQNQKVTAFQPGFRMIVGSPMYRTAAEAAKFRQLTFTCLDTLYTRTGETTTMPTQPCKEGIMANVRFPTCWDGKTLDPPNHTDHVAYPASGTFESGGACPSTHPVRIPQVFYEVLWDTRRFNDRSLWPEDGSQPFVWSYGDFTGYGTHGDYVFGWKGDSLQRAMDTNCDGPSCAALRAQSIATGNQCRQDKKVAENIDGWLSELPGGVKVTGPQPGAGTGKCCWFGVAGCDVDADLLLLKAVIPVGILAATLVATLVATPEATLAAEALARLPSGMHFDSLRPEDVANILVGASAAARRTTGARRALRGRPAGLKTIITLSACELAAAGSSAVSGAGGQVPRSCWLGTFVRMTRRPHPDVRRNTMRRLETTTGRPLDMLKSERCT